MAPKIRCISCINTQCNLLDPVIKIQKMTRMKFDSNKIICPDFGRFFFYSCIDYHNDLQLVDTDIQLPLHQLQEMPYHLQFFLFLEFIIILIQSTYSRLLLTNLDPLLCKIFEAFSGIHVRLEAIVCE